MTGSFTSFYSFLPHKYVSKGENFLTISPDGRSLYKQNIGEYNNYFGVKAPSYITLLVNPESDLDCVFDNIEYKSEVRLNDVEQQSTTLTHVQLWNEYQDSGKIPLTLHSNITRKFRSWRATLPRQANSRDRIRNPWVFLKLSYEGPDNTKLVLHDVIIQYSV